MALIYLFDVTAAVDAAGTQSTFGFCTGTGYNHPSASRFYHPRIIQPANFRRDLFTDGRTFGASRASYGIVAVANPDGIYDALLSYGYGFAGLLRLGDDRDDIANFVTVQSGYVEQPVHSFAQIDFRFKDRQVELDLPYQSTKYAGTNSGATGQEGTADDLKGKPKPRTIGKVFNVTPVAANTSQYIFQVHDGAVNDIPQAYNAGASLTKGADYTNLADMTTNAPAGGGYRVLKSAGMYRVGTAPTNPTCNVVQGATAADRTVAQLVKAELLRAGVSSGDISSADVTALDAANDAEVGIYTSNETTFRPIIDALLGSIGAWCVPNRLGVYRMGRIVAPSGTPVATLKRLHRGDASTATDGDILSIERVAMNDPGRGVPTAAVNLSWYRNHTTQVGGDIAGSVTPDRIAFLKDEFRVTSNSDASIYLQFPKAPTFDIRTLLVDSAEADAERDRLLALYKVKRDRLRVKIKFGISLIGSVDLGAIINLQIPRYGYDAGKLFVVLGIEYDMKNDVADLEIWG